MRFVARIELCKTFNRYSISPNNRKTSAEHWNVDTLYTQAEKTVKADSKKMIVHEQ